ncbi:enoyl-CoA hydratase/isomerase family protein [Rhizobiaceae bacterium n13]|uniref:3-hydroxyisobutyryl-CoA hydrolase n=1 Tax=Ferirhizobium litorale TaxID=2927786 RepID=A0AAE3U315_9HYPH|nr:enoyl-CoA hydratase/isomerase family protein [Fererhizobium litorale]MDI7861790.1 enoyl-CoA hydratase/isomerase family protein [Fererhizobium litorale]MDI7921868.1 enoyl-CoA hydratase/isomerase family protein [Fererhizobium litorale]
MSDLVVRTKGRAGRITLDRQTALNALNHSMVTGIAEALDLFQSDDNVALVVIDGAGEKAFCAGGDIVMLYETGKTNPEIGRSFWRDEYRLNARIARYPKPYVSILDGIVMGGGIGVGAHGSHRIVTERTVAAMPEVKIGFSPDVGGSSLLAHAPGHVGEYLAMTGGRMSGADAIFAGFADYFVPSARLRELVAALEETGDPGVIADYAEEPAPSELAAHAAEIDAIFDGPDARTILARLAGTPFAEKTANTIARNAPFSVVAALEAVRLAKRNPEIEPCLVNEYRFSHRVLEGHDLYEGIRALLIDKDNAPKWQPATVEGVDNAKVAAAYAPLGAEELRL